jgi:hypothetical protein
MLMALVCLIVIAGLLSGCGVISRRVERIATRVSGGSAPTVQAQGGSQPEESTPLPTEAAAGAAPAGGGTVTGDLDLIMLPDGVKNGAVCNDGSPAGYYYRRGVGAGTNLWVIHLQGGGLCNSVESCAQREKDEPNLMTSKHLPKSRAGNGIMAPLSSDSPDFFRANDVYVPYCSSDLWSGDRAASAATGNREFRGARILRSVIDALSDPSITPSPNLGDAKQVLFSGSSAGGVGVLANLDWLAERLPNASVRGMTDAGWLVDIAPFDPTIDPTPVLLQKGIEFWNGTVDASCAAANVDAEGRCYMGPYVYPYLGTPLFVQIAQYDGPQLNALGITRPLDEKKKQYAEQFAAAVRASLAQVQASFSPAAITHGILLDPEFWTTRIDGRTLSQVLGDWFFGRSGGSIKEIQ